MKKQKIFRLLFSLLFLVCIYIIPNEVFALQSGDTITYYAQRLRGRFAYFTVPGDASYEGTCRQHGVHLGNTNDNSECVGCKAKLSTPSDSRYAKVIYEFWYKQGWKDIRDEYAYSYLGLSSDVQRTYGRVLEGFIQIINMGASDFKSTMIESGGDSETMAQPTIDKFNAINFDSIVVPSTLEVYLGKATDPSDVQDFVLWKYVPLQASKNYASGSVGAGNAAVKVGDEITYSISWQYGDGATNIVDTLGAGLQYVSGSSNMGEPSISGQTLTWSGLTPASGTLTYKAKVTEAAGGTIVCNNATASNSVTSIPLTRICNPVPKKSYGGTSYADNKGWDHHEVLMPDSKKGREGDKILYKVVLPNAKGEAVNVTVSDVLSKGLTLNDDAAVTGGSLLNKTSTTNSETSITSAVYTVSVPANGTAVLTYSATVNSDAVNLVDNNAVAKYGSEPAIEIGSLANPVPRKHYDSDTANGMDGKIVQNADIITYNITYSNPYKESATINLRDTLSEGLTYKKGTAKVCDSNKENCKTLEEAGIKETVTKLNDGKTQILWTRTNIGSYVSEIIVYSVTVEGKTIRVENDFDIKTCRSTASTQATETIANCKEQPEPTCVPNCSLNNEDGSINKNCKEETATECVNKKQECTFTDTVCNGTWMDIDELKNPKPEKIYNPKTPAGYNHAAVSERDRIRYEIKYENVDTQNIDIKITDTISKGIEFIKSSFKINNVSIPEKDIKFTNNNKKFIWTDKNVEPNKERSLTYEVLVTGETSKVKNKACTEYSNNPKYIRCLRELENPVPQKTYASTSKVKKTGQRVSKKDIIIYSIKYSNSKDESSNVIIMDNLSKGLEYIKGSAKVNGKKIAEASVTKDKNGTMVVWMKEIKAGASEELTYSVRVKGDTSFVENNASIQYDDDPIIKLDELRNPLLSSDIINVPNTGSTIAIAGIVAGIGLVVGGSYLIYRRYKNA